MNYLLIVRGKDKDNGNWYQGYYVLLHDTTYCCLPSKDPNKNKEIEEKNTHHYIIFEQMTDWNLPNNHLRAEILPDTLCRCTNIHSKDGRYIFENDIVEYKRKFYKVTWDDNHHTWVLKNKIKCIPIDKISLCDSLYIRGNSIDNPQLLIN